MSEEIKLTKEEALQAFGIKENTLYKWMKEGKVRYIQVKRNRIITLSKEEYRNLIEEQKLYQQTTRPDFQSSSKIKDAQIVDNLIVDHQESMKVDDNTASNLIDFIRELKTELVEKAEIAGKVKLLSDDSTFYKNEYFKLKYELENLTKVNQEQEKIIKELEAKNKNPLTSPISELLKGFKR